MKVFFHDVNTACCGGNFNGDFVFGLDTICTRSAENINENCDLFGGKAVDSLVTGEL